jgi:hypothetical protein
MPFFGRAVRSGAEDRVAIRGEAAGRPPEKRARPNPYHFRFRGSA